MAPLRGLKAQEVIYLQLCDLGCPEMEPWGPNPSLGHHRSLGSKGPIARDSASISSLFTLPLGLGAEHAARR